MSTMKPSEAARILAVAAVYDRRTISELDARAWAFALDQLDVSDCMEAVRRHYRNSTDWCMPAHVRALVTVVRRDRANLAKAERLQLEHSTARELHDPASSHCHYLAASEALAAKRAEIESRSASVSVGEATK